MEPLVILQGDALLRLREMDADTFDAVITDPPYASGGMSMSEKSKSTRDKYTSYASRATHIRIFPAMRWRRGRGHHLCTKSSWSAGAWLNPAASSPYLSTGGSCLR